LEKFWKAITGENAKADSDLVQRAIHRTVKKVGEDVQTLEYNTAISALMICLNDLKEEKLSVESKKVLVKLLAPFAPFMSEELWRVVLKQKGSVHVAKWPQYEHK
jgi:leucyl-tRNA synthetase